MLIRSIENFLRRHAMSPTRFSRMAVSDPRFVFDLRNGREPRARTRHRVETFMRAYEEMTHAA